MWKAKSLTVTFNQKRNKMADPNRIVKINEFIMNHFNQDELNTLSFQMGIDFENITGDSKESKAREFVLHLARRNRLAELEEMIQGMRPGIPLDHIMVEETDEQPSAADKSKSTFKTDVSGGQVGQIINIDKLEGGLNINRES